ncbi:MAG: hypothetical protein A2075_21745 [Geobacteraceae bacterium GWC2_58_44]|nr:MAG: hypothetical protein A2075_21745 [Geobacteraceae bacterium GWC2_58_44]
MKVQDIAKPLMHLKELRTLHGFRAETLAPDLAFIGLVDDVIDATEEALDLVAGPRPHRAYAMVRVAFEAAQRLIVLATSDDYVHLGTRAWLYYVGKDEALGGRSRKNDKIIDYRDNIVETWALRYKDAHAVVQEEIAALKKLKGPDNFLGKDMAGAVATAYEVLGKAFGTDVPGDVAEVTRTAYRALCRDTHACLRLEPRGVAIDSDGFVDIVKRERNVSEIQKGVATGLSSSLGEATTAVQFRIQRRRDSSLVAIRTAVDEYSGKTDDQFRRDFGLFLLERGLANATQVFTGMPLHNIAVLPDGTVSSSTTIGADDEIFMATFDFKGECADQILEQLRQEFPSIDLPDRHSGERRVLHLPNPFIATLAASIGYFRHTDQRQLKLPPDDNYNSRKS